MERLLNILRGDEKRTVESIGKSKNLYAAALQSLKRDCGNTFYVSQIKLSELFDKSQIKALEINSYQSLYLREKSFLTKKNYAGTVWLKVIY